LEDYVSIKATESSTKPQASVKQHQTSVFLVGFKQDGVKLMPWKNPTRFQGSPTKNLALDVYGRRCPIGMDRNICNGNYPPVN